MTPVDSYGSTDVPWACARRRAHRSRRRPPLSEGRTSRMWNGRADVLQRWSNRALRSSPCLRSARSSVEHVVESVYNMVGVVGSSHDAFRDGLLLTAQSVAATIFRHDAGSTAPLGHLDPFDVSPVVAAMGPLINDFDA